MPLCKSSNSLSSSQDKTQAMLIPSAVIVSADNPSIYPLLYSLAVEGNFSLRISQNMHARQTAPRLNLQHRLPIIATYHLLIPHLTTTKNPNLCIT
jgi:hypothetical protein